MAGTIVNGVVLTGGQTIKEISYVDWQGMSEEEKNKSGLVRIPDYPEILTAAQVNEKVEELKELTNGVGTLEATSYLNASNSSIKWWKYGKIVVVQCSFIVSTEIPANVTTLFSGLPVGLDGAAQYIGIHSYNTQNTNTRVAFNTGGSLISIYSKIPVGNYDFTFTYIAK